MVSIIVPIYNAEAYLAQCLSSLREQTYRDIEIILVDDGSTDASAEIAHAYCQADKRYTLLQEENSGQAAARNMGLQHATGEFILFVDADDSIATDYVEQHLQAIGEADMTQAGYQRITTEGDILASCLPTCRYTYTTPWGRLYKRAFLIENGICFPEGMIYEDVIFSLNIWGLRPRIVMMPYVGYRYLYNPHSTTAHPHPDAVQKLMRTIRQTAAPKWLKYYTRLRLRLHFIKETL